MGALVPFPPDRTEAVELAREAVVARHVPGEDPAEVLPVVEEVARMPAPPGRLYRGARGAVGIVLWQPTSPIGVALGVVYVRPPAANAAEYGELLRRAAELLGPVPFVPGPLAGIDRGDEAALLGSLGYARFGRLEMRRDLADPIPSAPPERGRNVRTARVDDESSLARLHARAYGRQFDRYLFLSDADPDRDAERSVRDTVGGAHGEFLADASAVVEESGSIVGACLVVRRPYGPLIVDVMTDPVRQARGIGRAALVEALARLAARGEPSVALNVTVGNGPALRLYAALGFAPSIGPSEEWYHTGLVPVAPGGGYVAPAGGAPASRSPVE